MKLRYDFGKSLNLSDFKSRFTYNLGKEVSYIIYLYDFRINIDTSVDKKNIHISIFSVDRDIEDDVIVSQIICPMRDKRLESLDIIKELFFDDEKYYAEVDLDKDKFVIVKNVCDLIYTLYKVSRLKVFI